MFLGTALFLTHLLEMICFLQSHLSQSKILLPILFLLAAYQSHLPSHQYLLGLNLLPMHFQLAAYQSRQP
jgi:hypothetical protein